MVLVHCPDCQKAIDRGGAWCRDCGRNLEGNKPSLRLGRPQFLSHFVRVGYPLLVGIVIWMLVVILA